MLLILENLLIISITYLFSIFLGDVYSLESDSEISSSSSVSIYTSIHNNYGVKYIYYILGISSEGRDILAKVSTYSDTNHSSSSSIHNDSPETWNLFFQDEATAIQAGIIDFHNYAMYYLIIVFSFVVYFLFLRIFSNRTLNWYRSFNHSTVIEVIWTILPGVILILIGIPSLKLLYELDSIQYPLVTLKATGAQWFWTYELNDIEGLSISFDSYTLDDLDLSHGHLRLLDVDNRVLLPILTPIRLLITSQDVIHSFYVPSLGIKMDAVPGRINHSSFYLLRPGVYYGQCAELCGQSHHKMSIVIQAVDTPSYLSWLASFI